MPEAEIRVGAAGLITVDGSEHPLVFAALGSHANYTTPETMGRRPGGFNPGFSTSIDALDNGGARWRTWNHFVILNPDGPARFSNPARDILAISDGLRVFAENGNSLRTETIKPQEWVNYNGRWGNWLVYDRLVGYRSLGPRSPRFGPAAHAQGNQSWTALKPLFGAGAPDRRPALAKFGGNLFQLITGKEILVSQASDGIDWIAPEPAASARGDSACPEGYSGVDVSTGSNVDAGETDDWFLKLGGAGATTPAAVSFNGALYLAFGSGVGDEVELYRTANGGDWCKINLTARANVTGDTRLGLTVFNGIMWIAGKGTAGDASVYLTSSQDGFNWTPYTAAETPSGTLKSMTGPALEAFTGGGFGDKLFMAVTRDNGGDNLIALTSSTNGNEWSSPNDSFGRVSERRRPPGQTTRPPAMAAFDGNLYVAVSSASYRDALVWTRSPDGQNFLPWSAINGASETGPDVRMSQFIGDPLVKLRRMMDGR